VLVGSGMHWNLQRGSSGTDLLDGWAGIGPAAANEYLLLLSRSF
jgi:hypothetical protein